ncbi:APM4 [[Candida] subhashii]|uniref:APM4 n=1 Tax=[Candida] subhashii TaxID=561895 RepID=A0A8J5QDT7_9ASCO|nr:APM4 [[Candida] subhashii]KAG7661452.1 APM4 [[Candida] subhashii]
MISALFLYDAKGDVLISKLYKDDIKRAIADVFRIQVITAQQSRDTSISSKSPVLTLGSTSFIYIKSGNVWICAVTRSNQDCATILEYLYKLEGFLKVVLSNNEKKLQSAKELNDELITNNFNLVYEIINESCEFGYPTNLDLSYLKNFITCFNDTSASDNIFKLIRKQSTKKRETTPGVSSPVRDTRDLTTSNITWRAPGIKYRRNEIFLNVTEKINILMNSQSDILRSYVDGSVQMKTHLSGMPVCRFGFNENTVLINPQINNGNNTTTNRNNRDGTVVLEDSKFHQCVELNMFETERIIQFIPPDGEFQLMTYNCHSNVNIPFRVYPQIQPIDKTRIMYKIRMKSFYPVKIPATNVLLRIPTPRGVSSTYVSNITGGKAKYHPEENEIHWNFNKFFGNQEHVLTVEVELRESDKAATGRPGDVNSDSLLLYWNRPPMTLDFKLDMVSCSGLTVRFLRVLENDKYRTVKWVKYSSQAGSYEIRY